MTDLSEAVAAAIAPIIEDRVEMVERETETSIEINGAHLAAECAAAVLAVPEVARALALQTEVFHIFEGYDDWNMAESAEAAYAIAKAIGVAT